MKYIFDIQEKITLKFNRSGTFNRYRFEIKDGRCSVHFFKSMKQLSESEQLADIVRGADCQGIVITPLLPILLINDESGIYYKDTYISRTYDGFYVSKNKSGDNVKADTFKGIVSLINSKYKY